MENLVNLTRCAVAALPSVHRDGEELLVVVIAGQYRLPPAGRASAETLTLAEAQPPVPLADVYYGEPGRSSLRYEAQTAYAKPGTDIHLLGHAWAPDGHPVREGMVGLQVGSCRSQAVVYGDRQWRRGLGELRPSTPQPFERVALRYEHAFGGPCGPAARPLMDASTRNPVGCGLVTPAAEAGGQPLPNLELPQSLLRGPKDLPLPAGFGPIGRHWLPRRQYSGTYDDAWVRTRAPRWPDDLDDRFFCAAPPALCAIPHLRGGEPALVVGCRPDGDLRFVVPAARFRVRVELRRRRTDAAIALDGLVVEPDEGTCTVYWRAHVRTGRDLAGLGSIVVRELEPWEAAA